MALDESLAEAHTSLAYVKQNFDWDFAGAEKEFKRAIELKPNYATAHQWYAAFLSDMGHHPEAIAEAQRALELDPLSIPVNTAAAAVYCIARKYDTAERQLQRALELDPNFAAAHAWLAIVYFFKGMYPQYLEENQVATDLIGKEEDKRIAAAMTRAYGRSGYKAMLSMQAEMQEDLLQHSSAPQLSALVSATPYNIAVAFALLGDKDRAIEWLERCYRERAFELVALNVDPSFDNLHSDPRFQDLVRRIGLP